MGGKSITFGERVIPSSPADHVTDWRVVEQCPIFEISADGFIRNRRNGRVYECTDEKRIAERFRPSVNGVRYYLIVSEIRNQAFPELDPWP